MDRIKRSLVDFHMSRLGCMVTLDETHPAGCPPVDRHLDALYDVALIGAEAREDGPAVVEEACRAVAHALFTLNFGAEALVEALQRAWVRDRERESVGKQERINEVWLLFSRGAITEPERDNALRVMGVL